MYGDYDFKSNTPRTPYFTCLPVGKVCLFNAHFQNPLQGPGLKTIYDSYKIAAQDITFLNQSSIMLPIKTSPILVVWGGVLILRSQLGVWFSRLAANGIKNTR